MRCRQRTRILHMCPQIPELLQAYSRNIHNIITLRNGRVRVISVRHRRGQRHHESCEVLV